MSLKTKSIIAVAAVAALSAGFWASSVYQSSVDTASNYAKEKALEDARKRYSPIQGTILSTARKIVIPDLTKDNGEKFTLDDLTGQWHLLFFGYTHCPDICPTTMTVLAQAKKTATTKKQMFPQIVFVTVDPERDTVAMLGEYIRYFDKDFIGVTGDKDLIKAFTLQMSVVYMKMPVAENSDAGDYLVDHSSAILLLNPDGKLVASFKTPHDANNILKDFQTVVNNSH